MTERNEGDDMDNWGEDTEEEESGDDDSDDDEEIDDDDDNNDDDEDDSEDSESDEEEIDDDGVEDEIFLEKFIRTFHNGDYDAEIDDTLSLDRSPWHSPARPTRASYNKPDNWRERNRIGLEKVKRHLQSYIHSVSHGSSVRLQLIHNIGYGPPLMNGEAPIVWHEPILDEHWDQLEDALSGNELVTNIQHIQIENVEMKKERLAALVAILISGRATNASTYVIFNNANLCSEGIISLSTVVDVSSELQTLFINHNRIDNLHSACCLSRSLKSHTCINHLHLTHCDLGSSPEVLSVILHADVNRIILDNNNIDSLGAVTIAEYLEGDPPICHIELDHNCLNDDDAILISQALKMNTHLDTLHIQFNNLTSIGVKALLTCVFDSSTLNAISESNHTLETMQMLSRDASHIVEGNIRTLLRLDRTQKILLALQHKDSLLQYLANIPVELIPEVLAFPLRQGDNQRQHKRLNIVYSTMRWWNMPMLYSYHNYVKSDTKRKRDD
jgi:hypothetical protein